MKVFDIHVTNANLLQLRLDISRRINEQSIKALNINMNNVSMLQLLQGISRCVNNPSLKAFV